MTPARAAARRARRPGAGFAGVVTVLLACTAASAAAAGRDSRYLVLDRDREAAAGATVELLATTVQVAKPGWLYLQADGGYAPGGAAIGNAWISVDGRLASNESTTDWRGSRAPNTRGFNLVGAVRVGPGPVRVVLHGRSAGAATRFLAGGNLSAMTTSATEVRSLGLTAPSPWLDFDTRETPEREAAIPEGRGRRALLATRAGEAGGPVVAMASGRAWAAPERPGDAMWGIFLDGREPSIADATWSINDLFPLGAETQAPMFVQALFALPRGGGEISLVASESPYYQPRMASTNALRYRVGRNSRLVTLAGMGIAGKAAKPGFDYAAEGRHRRYAYTCLGTNGFNPAKCPPMPAGTGGEVVIGRGEVCIPEGHDGVVLFAAKTRIQGDDHDDGGTVTLRIRVDGRFVGNTALQGLGPKPHTVSTRTLSASWLATGREALEPGCHVAEAVGHAQGDFRNISMNADLPLLWFD